MTTPGQDNFDNKNSVEQNGNNNENNDKNWFQRQWESFKNLIDSKKNKIEEDTAFQSNELQKNAIDSALDNLHANIEKGLNIDENDMETKDKLNNFFEEGKHEFHDNIDTPEEAEFIDNFVKKYPKLEKRNKLVVKGIANSVNEIEDFFRNWHNQGPIVSGLLKLVDIIMKTEK